MKTLLITTFFIIIGIIQLVNAQERFRRDYNFVSVNSPSQSKNIFSEGRNVFVFNYGDNADVLHVTSKGKSIVYIRTTPIDRAKGNDGFYYSYFKALDQFGEPILIKVYDKEENGVMLFFKIEDDEEFTVFHFKNH
ncbi:MAG: hypothetical protein WED10_06395 [Brumimicrobium sp.]